MSAPFGITLWPPFTIVGASASLVLFGNELANYLRANLSVNAYPVKLPQGITTYPLLAYTIVDGDSELKLSGTSGLAFRSVQFDAYSPLSSDVETLAEQIRNLFQPLLNSSMGRLTVTQATLQRTMTFATPSASGQDGASIYRTMSEYTIWFRETAH